MFLKQGALVDALYGKNPRHFSTSRRAKIAYGAACGLAHLHDQNIVHRDIAARNVLLSAKFVAKLGDFGMAREMEPENKNNTHRDAKATIGPLRWMVIPMFSFFRFEYDLVKYC